LSDDVDRKDAPGLEFPLEFPIKAMGLSTDQFQTSVVDLISEHIDLVDLLDVTARPSSAGKYVSITVLIMARSRDQLDAIYDALTAHPDVLMRL